MFVLPPAEDTHFAWLLGECTTPNSLTLADGGLETPATISMLRALANRLRPGHGEAAWLIVAGGEVVGMISAMTAENAAGETEIGFGIAASRRRRGYASQAVAALVDIWRARPGAGPRALTAETAVWNTASQRALASAGFAQCYTRTDAEDGPVIGWRHSL